MDNQTLNGQDTMDDTPELEALVEAFIKTIGGTRLCGSEGTHPIHTLDIEIELDSSVRARTENAGRSK